MSDPKVIGRYEIVEELGRGAMGSVFKARDPAVGRIVALKTIHSAALEGAQSDEYRARFYREARASGVLAHPGIVPVFDVGEHEGAPFLVMEFVAGRTLDSVIKKGERYSLDRVCEIGQQIAEALGYAHRQGVIHRDIKPANILMTSREVYGSERPRITDFGIAKLAASEITTTGQLLGTPSYMPPEQFTGAPIDGRADLFSLGVILYSLATGEQPFPGETMTAVSYKVVHTEAIPPAKLNPGIPARLEAVIMKCLAKSPADRFQTGEELAQELAALRSGATASTMHATVPVAGGADVTLGPTAGPTTIPPGVTAQQAGRAATPATATAPGAKAAKKPGKPARVQTVFAVVLLSVAGLAAITVGGWFWLQHRKQPAPVKQQATVVPTPQPPAPVVPPQGTAPAGETHPATPTPAPGGAVPAVPAAAPTPPGAKTPGAKTPATKPSAAKPSPTKATPAPAQPAAAAVTPPAPAPAPAPAPVTKPQPLAPAALAFDPRNADPNKNAKIKIDVSKFPKGLAFTVEMNKEPYVHFITGDGSSLDNLYAPPGMQVFQVSFKNSGQTWAAKPVGSDFKAKKSKTLKVQLLENGKADSKITLPISKDAQLSISFSSTLGDLF
jgi:serine/threonine-protein kinase